MRRPFATPLRGARGKSRRVWRAAWPSESSRTSTRHDKPGGGRRHRGSGEPRSGEDGERVAASRTFDIADHGATGAGRARAQRGRSTARDRCGARRLRVGAGRMTARSAGGRPAGVVPPREARGSVLPMPLRVRRPRFQRDWKNLPSRLPRVENRDGYLTQPLRIAHGAPRTRFGYR